MKQLIRRLRRARRARGTAVVEFAVILPMLVLILFGIIEFGYGFMVRQSLQNAAREGCRLAAMPSSESSEVVARVQEVMAPTNVTGYQIQQVSTAATCQELVTVTVSYASISLVGDFFGLGGQNLVGTCTMRKEGCVEPG